MLENKYTCADDKEANDDNDRTSGKFNDKRK